MPPFRCIVYISTATRELEPGELDALLTSARSFNARHGITGVLLYAFPNFLQLLEGDAKSIEAALARVMAARAHTDVHILFDDTTKRRQFAQWHMALVLPPQTELLAIAQSTWQESLDQLVPRAGTLGLELVVETWRRWSQPAAT